ncbi:MAG: hypothetical protein DMG31_19330 [Acidobacteria bacterium]|nr:MAG: hypothetical protein DMG31_19330 [Acidobacteriota bacterium]
MKSEIRRIVAFLAAAALLAPAGSAQNPQQPAAPPPQVSANQKGAIKAAVNLVEVDVAVSERDGKLLKGLRQDQFSIAEDGKDQKISTFDYYDVEKLEKADAAETAPITIPIGSVAAPEQVRQQVRDRRMIVLFFDLTSLQPNDLTRSTLAAKQFLSKQMTSADLVGVVAFGNQLRVIADFTNDRDLLDSAVDALLPGKEAQLAALAAATSTGIDAAVTEESPCCNSRAASRKPAKTIARSFAPPRMPPIAPTCPFTLWIRAACWRKSPEAMPAPGRRAETPCTPAPPSSSKAGRGRIRAKLSPRSLPTRAAAAFSIWETWAKPSIPCSPIRPDITCWDTTARTRSATAAGAPFA